MRPGVLNHGYKPGTKVLFAMIRLFSGRPLPDAAKLTFYRRDFYGGPAGHLTQLALRGPSQWSVGDRELMAAVVSRANGCSFCVGAHTATAELAYADRGRVRAVLADLATAPIEEGLRATLRLLDVLTRDGSVSVGDMRTVLAAGVSRERIEDALAVAAAFNITNRLADAFAFATLDPSGYAAGARFLLRRGYGK
ncbi:carboxymuconolactone decarboxylase family protein [Dactylosporangium sp. NPDC051541]|uniref:carboxymuconolactone decarboxylase family protein n=1 Tax=Dactylosporangium sp. NPDC051541 TaxID=3363977 RepID=UPI0037B53AEC